jgi:hypothetical protein
MKRSKRRNRWRLKAKLRELDQLSLNRIKQSYMASATTWGGTRCPDCGIQVRPHWLTYHGGSTLVDEEGRWAGHISTTVIPPCDHTSECKGYNPDWEMKSSERFERKLARGEVKLW